MFFIKAETREEILVCGLWRIQRNSYRGKQGMKVSKYGRRDRIAKKGAWGIGLNEKYLMGRRPGRLKT